MEVSDFVSLSDLKYFKEIFYFAENVFPFLNICRRLPHKTNSIFIIRC